VRGERAGVAGIDGDNAAISWPARDVVWHGARGGHPALSPVELAALVVARSGVSLTIEEE
jgi:hypothetical protein